MLARISSGPRARFTAIAAALVFGIGLSGAMVARNGWAAEPGQKAGKSADSVPLRERTSVLAAMQSGFVAIAERVEPAIVSVRAKRTIRTAQAGPDLGDLFGQFRALPGVPRGMTPMPRQFRAEAGGSGVVVRSDGWILTNDHVVDGADKVTVKLNDGREFEGTVRRDFRSDLALIKIPVDNLPALQFADSDEVRVGQWAIAFGSPFSLDETMTLGIVSARGRQTTISEGGEGRFYPSLIQTDASVNPGNSGGPLVDITGRIMGINVAINSPTGGSVGIGFAIPANSASDVVDQLIEHGKVTRGFLGLVPSALTPVQRDRYGVKSGGALVESVQDGTPAAKAGVQVEDVIVRFNGRPVNSDVDLRRMAAGTRPDTTVDVVVRRGGAEKTLRVTLGSAPNVPAQEQPRSDAEEGGKLGIRVEPLTPERARQFNLGSDVSGVIVTGVQNGGPASDAGLQPGDVIMRANGRAVRNAEDLSALTSDAKSGDRIALVVMRDKSRSLVTLRIP
ncbi:MAG: Do family serine endopeptidase [Chthonomonadales bacterium]|nr:Do family serine endopeptidase [Chthonomonadales bacterium]